MVTGLPLNLFPSSKLFRAPYNKEPKKDEDKTLSHTNQKEIRNNKASQIHMSVENIVRTMRLERRSKTKDC